MIKLGEMVKDTVTGFKGRAVARIEYLNGCVQVCVKPAIGADGKMPAGEYVDVQQLVAVSGKREEAPSGGVMADAPKGGYGG